MAFFVETSEVRALLINLLLFCIVFLFGLPCLSAEEIDHHGQLVEIDRKDVCIDCHDEMDNHTHPVFIKYPPPGKESNFAPASALAAAGIFLVKGEVTCISCHNPANKSPSHLIIDNQNSKICLICHIK